VLKNRWLQGLPERNAESYSACAPRAFRPVSWPRPFRHAGHKPAEGHSPGPVPAPPPAGAALGCACV